MNKQTNDQTIKMKRSISAYTLRSMSVFTVSFKYMCDWKLIVTTRIHINM